jgi:two-component system nitrogen regulation sensor histidine kinase NtrY
LSSSVVALVAVAVAAGWLLGRRRRAAKPLASLTGVLAAFRDGDYSIRVAERPAPDPLALLFAEVNRLGEQLRRQRLGRMEADVLLTAVMSEIDVAILAFDDAAVVRLANPAIAALLGRPLAELTGSSAAVLGVQAWLDGPAPRTVQGTFPGGAGRWELRRYVFRQGGRRHTLVVLADLGRALREEERAVWQRLIRVLGHELNNSLTPIRSIATSLRELVQDDPLPADWRREAADGLEVIATRAGALGRFLGSYARLAKLPPPRPAPIDVQAWVTRVAQIETRLGVCVLPGAAVRLHADPDQMDQLLINLTRNAADAALETAGGVTVAWTVVSDRLELTVADDGPGLSQDANLFVPFFTTKPGGTGIGLVLCRQIAEAHGGTLTLANRPDRRGCVAALSVPLGSS